MNYHQYSWYIKGENHPTIGWLQNNYLRFCPNYKDRDGNLLHLYECSFEFLEFMRESITGQNYIKYKLYRRPAADRTGRVELVTKEILAKIKVERLDLLKEVTTAAAAKVFA